MEIGDLNAAAALLFWDQSTYMPPGGAEARGRQLGLLKQLAHERSTDPALGALLDALQPYAESLPADSDEACLVRVARREYEQAVRIPADFMARLTQHQTQIYTVWAAARPENDFAAVAPYLEKTVDLSRQMADFFPGYAHIADPLIDFSDYGMTVAAIRPLFADLRERLRPMVEAIAGNPPVDVSFLHRHFPEDGQWAFGLDVIERLGYDFEHGRQDKTHHPFTIKFSLDDVRITTRVHEDDLTEALFGTIHESGHAMYEQGIDRHFEATPLGSGTSSGVHESQSRLWENLVGRSRRFWQFFYPRLQETFPKQLEGVTLDAFYQAINEVKPSLIRTSADEVTYNLHIIIRFDLELALLEGDLAVRDLPEAWRARYQSDLGVTPPDDKDGVMQDIHWYAGMVGGEFQGYTLGNILSAQFFDAAVSAHPEIPEQIAAGSFGQLHGWLRENIYRHGSKFTAAELVERVTGGPMRLEPYIRYLHDKFGELYEL
ncbi:MAG: carboxypeptidase M32 [Anaerolineae bacterium]|nr:carboxypeptidase M32 [Anaerolineae bacterium]